MKKAPENFKQQERDADMIFKQMLACNFLSYREVEEAIVKLYVPDFSVSRSGISRALGKLKLHYEKKEKSDA